MIQSTRIAQLKTPLLTGSDVEQKRAELKAYFRNSWDTYESLFALINNDDAFLLRPEPLRHPLIFYYGHTAVFYVNKLILGKYLEQRIDPRLESLCAIGVDEMSWDDLDSRHYDWPSADEVRCYRQRVAATIEKLIDEMPLSLPITQDSLAWIILMGSEHERIHLETSSVIMRMLPLEYLDNQAAWQACPYAGDAPENALRPVAAQSVVQGKTEEDPTYGWDNEYGEQTTLVEQFDASTYLVSNQEFMAFIEDGGYHSPEFWTEEGQGWLKFTKAEMPRFWLKRNGNYYQRNLLEEVPLPKNWPVEVNYLEAKAFCNWKADKIGEIIRLPSEAEWYCLRELIETDQPYWQEAPGNVNLEYFASSCPVDKFETAGFYDIIGNVWQWTESPIDGFAGFEVHPLYDDFSTPTFDGKHNLFKGGSWISTGNEAIKSSRYAFRRHFFQHAGFRYIRAQHAEPNQSPVLNYETDPEITRQLETHYGESRLGLPNFQVNSVDKLREEIELGNQCRVLDIGCTVGRASFELARYAGHVDAIDMTARHIQQGYALVEQGEHRYTSPTEGELVNFNTINLQELGYQEAKQRVNFVQGDPCNLKSRFTGYDLVLANDLIDKLNLPVRFLEQIRERINSKGYLVITSTYNWDSEVTKPENWIGGIKVNGENFTTLDGLTELLIPHFTLVSVKNLPLVVPHSKRRALVAEAEMTIWRKR
ncbi:5-histidylcysteine sulfoxide synthase [Corallincola platygyrae]|uniref:5-histidylcysteine sulfoxide synthase n=1 Tax=Corallincola platygyrae TaxID=1193278 RepID=A0ABW4XQ39_9GAMM